MPSSRDFTLPLVLLTSLLTACATTTPTDDPTDRKPESPAIAGRVGTAVRSWVINDRVGDIARALAEIDQKPAVGPREEALELWRRAGLRVYRLPRARIEELQTRLTPKPGEIALDRINEGERVSSAPTIVQLQWVDQGPTWVSVATGSPRPQGGVVALHDSRLVLGPGPLRLLMRCWTIPVATGRADEPVGLRMRVQMVPQHASDEPKTVDPLATPESKLIATNGLVLRRLLMTLELGIDEGLLIVPEEPTRDWAKVLQDEETPPEGEDPALPPLKPGEVRREGEVVEPLVGEKPKPPTTKGPDSARVPSLGEEMLTARGKGGGARVLLAIVPEGITR